MASGLPVWELQVLLEPWLEISSEANLVVSSLCTDSRICQSGALFVCLFESIDSTVESYIRQAVEKGAVAVLSVVSIPHSVLSDDSVVGYVWSELKERWPEFVARYFDYPGAGIQLAAFTGTNGKTTCAWWLAQVIEHLGAPCGVLGTLGSGRVMSLQSTGYTTPDLLQLQSTLFHWREQGVRFGSLEASSHGIDQGRLDGVPLDVAVLTNLSRDHLDYHGSMEVYESVKARLFEWPGLKHAVLNLDEPMSLRVIARLQAQQQPFSTYRLDHGGVESDGVESDGVESDDVERVVDIASQAHQAVVVRVQDQQTEGSSVVVKLSQGDHTETVMAQWPFFGAYNIQNASAVLVAAMTLGFSFQKVVAALTHVALPPGRMQSISNPLNAKILVDYAHTPDALQKALMACREVCSKRLVVLFGCGGDRDKGKRQAMGAVAGELADHIILTNDNPRSESPQQIIEQILMGVPGAEGRVESISDRREAIAVGVKQLQSGDVLLVAGKGHESYQLVGTERIEFDDVKEITAVVASLGQNEKQIN